MKPLISDTHPEVERILIEGYRRMTPEQRLQRVRELNVRLEIVALAEIKSRLPQASEQELKMHLASRRIPHYLMQKVFGWEAGK